MKTNKITEPTNINREKKEWWAVMDGTVVHVTGYSCAPNNPDMWWCPEVGYTLSEKHHLFDRKEDAVLKALEEANRELMQWTQTVKKLKAMI